MDNKFYETFGITRKNYFEKLLPNTSYQFQGKRFFTKHVCVLLSRYLNEIYAEEDVTKVVELIYQWLRNWPIELEENLIAFIFYKLLQIVSYERHWGMIQKREDGAVFEKSTEGIYYMKLLQLQQECYVSGEGKYLKKYMKEYSERVGKDWVYFHYAPTWQRVKKRIFGHIGKNIMTNASLMILMNLLICLSPYCETTRRGKKRKSILNNDELATNRKEVAIRFSTLLGYFKIRTPKNLRKINPDKFNFPQEAVEDQIAFGKYINSTELL